MANEVFTFSPTFKEFLPTYRDVVRVWIGDGSTTGSSGMLYAEYEDGSVAEIGSVSLYATAVENGYKGTEAEWLQMIIGVANLVKGATATVKYMVSDSGETHPEANDSHWSDTPTFEKGKFTWCKTDLTWIDGTKTTYYTAAYQGLDGSVLSVNGKVGEVNLHGENIPIADNNNQNVKAYIDDREQSIRAYSDENDRTLKAYIDDSILPDIATAEDIDSLFSGVYLNGAIFIEGRQFKEGDSVTLQVEALTPNAPLTEPLSQTIEPTEGSSWKYRFGPLNFTVDDIPEGQDRVMFDYRVSQVSNTLIGVDDIDTSYTVSIIVINNEDGGIRISRSDNWNALHFSYIYAAAGQVTFEGTATLTGRRMAAREFTFQIAEGNKIIAQNVSTLAESEEGVPTAIAYPRIEYSLADVGLHTYTITETSQSGNGVTVSSASYTVTVNVTDTIRDGELEIEISDNWNHLDFVNVYAASGTAIIQGQTTITGRKLVSKDEYSLSITGSGKLPSPAIISPTITAGGYTIDFAFDTITYGLENMLDQNNKHLTSKTFIYEVVENTLLPGTSDDDKTHTVTINVDDNGRGLLSTTITYSDGAKLLFTDNYSASGSVVIEGTKTLQNRKYVATDRMTVTLSSTNSGRLPTQTTTNVPLTVGENVADFSFDQINYILEDLDGLETKTFSYIVTEVATIPGATNDTILHSVDVTVTDLWDGTFNIEPVYSDGEKVKFLSVYDATGYLNITGTKTITNRRFGGSDTLTVTLTSTDGNLPNTTVVPVSLSAGLNTADFSFNRITYKVHDLENEDYKTFHYSVAETADMPGTIPENLTDSFSVLVTDLKDGTLNIVPTYTKDNKVTFNNVYSATGSLSCKAKVVFTNGDLASNPFTVRITQVDGNNSTTQASTNVMLSTPVSLVANSGTEQTLSFDNIVTFNKNSSRDDSGKTYWFMIEEITPTLDVNRMNNNVQYDITKKWLSVSVTDNGLGQLVIAKTPASDSITGLDIVFTNEQYCDLSIVTLWAGDSDLLTTTQKNQATYLLTGPNSFSQTFTYIEMTNGTKLFEHLHLGSYALTESNVEYDGFVNTVSYKVGTQTTNIAELTDGTTKTITVTNSIDQLEGDLMILLNWTGDTSLLDSAYKNSIVYTVTGPNYERVLHGSDFSNDVYTLYQLTPGTYTVVTSNTSLENYEVNTGYTVRVNSTNIVNLTYHGDSIQITNNYNKLEASLTVSEIWTGDHFRLSQAQKNAFRYVVTGPKQISTNTETYRYEFASSDMTNGTFTLSSLTLGTYTVTAINNTVENFSITPTYNNGLIASNSVILADADSKTITISNNVNKLEGNLTIAHVWAGDYARLTAEQRNGLTFTVTGPKQSASDTAGFTQVFTLADMANGTKTFDRLTLGEYAVVVSNNSFENFAVSETYRVNMNETNQTTIADGETKTISITTNINKLEGNLTITKTWTGDFASLTSEQRNGVTFIVTGPRQLSSDANTYRNEFTYGDMDNGSITLTQLTLGTYSVIESDNVFENYLVDTTYSASDGGTSSVTLADGDSKTITINNAINKQEASLTITKSWSGDHAKLTQLQKNSVAFTVTGPKQTAADENIFSATFTCADMTNDTKTFEHLTLGTYTVTEINNVFSGFETSVTYTENSTQTNSVLLRDGDSKTISVENIVTEHTGSVKVTKLFDGITTEDIPSLFEVSNDYDSTVFTLATADNADDADGLNTPYEWTITNIPEGTTITFTETGYAIEGYSLKSISPTIKTSNPVVYNATVTLDFVNSYDVQTEPEEP